MNSIEQLVNTAPLLNLQLRCSNQDLFSVFRGCCTSCRRLPCVRRQSLSFPLHFLLGFVLDRGPPVTNNQHTVVRATRLDRALKTLFSRLSVTDRSARLLSFLEVAASRRIYPKFLRVRTTIESS